MIREVTRTARTSHYCCSCDGYIRPGEQYRVQVTSPGHDGIAPDHWAAWFRCVRCLILFGQEPTAVPAVDRLGKAIEPGTAVPDPT